MLSPDFLYTQYVNRLHRRTGHLWQNRAWFKTGGDCPLFRPFEKGDCPPSEPVLNHAQNRFYSCPLDERGLWSALLYVEQNPVRARLVRRAWDWAWSSAAFHCGRVDGPGLLRPADWQRVRPPGDWGQTLRRRQEQAEVDAIRTRTRTGRPLVGDAMLAKLERLLGRRLRPLPVGRPKGSRKGGRTK